MISLPDTSIAMRSGGRGVVLLALFGHCEGHGHMTYPPNRMGGNMSYAGIGASYGGSAPFLWFSQPVTIPGEPTLNEARYRTHNVDVQGGPKDWSRRFPWRAPGSAPVRGSGCGVAGGFDFPMPNGGIAPPGHKYGEDGLVLPENEPVQWRKGEVVSVAWSFLANHKYGEDGLVLPENEP